MKRLLLVEGDRRRAEVLADWLEEIGPIHIDILARVDDAIDWVSRYETRLVILSGPTLLDAVERLKRAMPTTGVIVLSEAPSVDEAVACMRIGADDYMARDVSLEALQRSARRALEKSAVFTDPQSAGGGLLDLMVTCQLISASTLESHVIELVRSYISRFSQSQWVGVYVSQEGQAPVYVPGPESQKNQTLSEVLEIAVSATRIFEGWEELFSDYRYLKKGPLAPSLLAVRFPWGLKKKIYWVALSPSQELSENDAERRFGLLKSQVESTSRTIDRLEGAQRLAYLDEVTGLFNVRYLSKLLDDEIKKSIENGHAFAVLFIDIDRFKSVNDQYGHLAGSRVLQLMGQLLKKWVPESRNVFRYGGDEFVALISNCTLKQALEIGERVRKNSENASFNLGDGISVKVTLSIGVALFPDHAQEKRDLMATADHAMYQAKRSTRNAVFIAEVPK
jgi:diguanylate cyclase (GGDEF)-like protein